MRIRKPIKDIWHITVKHNELAKWYKGGRHKGIDLRTRCKKYPNGIGVPIYSIADGMWGRVEYDRRMGNKVTLIHDNSYKTVYGHLSKDNYIEGYTKVKAGDCIGYSGHSGTYCWGPHLHFELIHNGVSINPLPCIKAGEDLVKWARSRAIMRIDDKGEIQFMVKNGIVSLNKENCWDILSKNTWGINKKDYNDLLDLI